MHLFSFFHSPRKHKISHKPNVLIKIEPRLWFPKIIRDGVGGMWRKESDLLNLVDTLLKSGNLKWPELDSWTSLRGSPALFWKQGNENLPMVQCPQHFQQHSEHKSIKAPSVSSITIHSKCQSDGRQATASGLLRDGQLPGPHPLSNLELSFYFPMKQGMFSIDFNFQTKWRLINY